MAANRRFGASRRPWTPRPKPPLSRFGREMALSLLRPTEAEQLEQDRRDAAKHARDLELDAELCAADDALIAEDFAEAMRLAALADAGVLNPPIEMRRVA